MRTLTPYRIARLMCDVRYAGAWFATDGKQLNVVYHNNSTPPLSDDMLQELRVHRPFIIAALQTIPKDCRLPTVRLLTGSCDCTTSRELLEGLA